jgi:hypothetical protein
VLRDPTQLEKDEKYDLRRRARLLRKEGELKARITTWYQGVVGNGEVGIAQVSHCYSHHAIRLTLEPFYQALPDIPLNLPSPSLLSTAIHLPAKPSKADVDLAVRLQHLNAVLTEGILDSSSKFTKLPPSSSAKPTAVFRPLIEGKSRGTRKDHPLEGLLH